MYAINPFLFWVSVKAPVIFLIAEGWGIKDEEEFFWGSHGFQGKLRRHQLSSTEYRGVFFFYRKLTPDKLPLGGGE